ncbi:MAG: Gfo/Idh/MocA family oxidoreductase, partial [Phycisphaerae bacterium]|nr:Gfo/Idh/MocA family oxidoreductase [Phycisphaerae bacterium]
HCLRFWPEYEMLKGLVDSGKYGPVSSALFRRISGQPSWPEDNWFADVSRSGGCALDMHIHDADAVQWFFGVPQKVAAHGTVDDDGGVNQIFTSYRYDSDIVVMAEGAWLPGTYPFSMSARIAFESAVAEFDTARQAGLTIYEGVSGEVQTPTVPQADPYAGELGYFVDCVASGRPVERVTAQDAARAVAIVEAEIKSVKTGRAVKIRG